TSVPLQRSNDLAELRYLFRHSASDPGEKTIHQGGCRSATIATATAIATTTTVTARRTITLLACGSHSFLRFHTFFTLGERKKLATRETNFARVLLDADDFDFDGIAFLHHIAHALDAMVRHLRNMEEAVKTGQNGDERAVVRDARDRARV